MKRVWILLPMAILLVAAPAAQATLARLTAGSLHTCFVTALGDQ